MCLVEAGESGFRICHEGEVVSFGLQDGGQCGNVRVRGDDKNAQKLKHRNHPRER